MLQVRAAHGVNPQRVAAPVQIARVVDVAVEIQIGVARLAHFGLQRAGHLGHGGGQTQRREQVGVVGHQRLHHVELRHAACAEVKQHPQRRGASDFDAIAVAENKVTREEAAAHGHRERLDGERLLERRIAIHIDLHAREHPRGVLCQQGTAPQTKALGVLSGGFLHHFQNRAGLHAGVQIGLVGANSEILLVDFEHNGYPSFGHFVDKSNQYRKGCKNIIRHQQENGKCFSHERRKIRIEKTGCTTQCSPLVDGHVATLPPILLLLISPARSAVPPGSSCRRACPCRERRHGHQSRKCSSDDTS